MAKLLDNEYSMVSFKTYKESKTSTIITETIITGLIDSCLGVNSSGSTKECVFTLTNNNLYIDHIGYDVTGQLEVFTTEKINRKDIKSFEVKKEGNEEIITLLRSKDESITYIRNNENSLDLATEMAKLIVENAGN